ncbi:ATP-binding protein [Lysinibacillus sp. LZ02]|uniref:ATP-binding protein n=1 Tax=Lysinibacillus sp. LZ02 TaxID=3420668 RepID=UPI003D369BCB
MELLLSVEPNQQAIQFVNQTITTFAEMYEIPTKRELCFVVHELVINAVEAMKQMQFTDVKKIEIHITKDKDLVKVTVTDEAMGIPEEKWDSILAANFEDVDFSDRGRGFLFIKNMVDEIWFEHLSDNRFLVGIQKKINV